MPVGARGGPVSTRGEPVEPCAQCSDREMKGARGDEEHSRESRRDRGGEIVGPRGGAAEPIVASAIAPATVEGVYRAETPGSGEAETQEGEPGTDNAVGRVFGQRFNCGPRAVRSGQE